MEGYLLQLVYLVLQRPHTSLERVLIDLCARSLRIAAKVTPSQQQSAGSGPLSEELLAQLRAAGRAAVAPQQDLLQHPASAAVTHLCREDS